MGAISSGGEPGQFAATAGLARTFNASCVLDGGAVTTSTFVCRSKCRQQKAKPAIRSAKAGEEPQSDTKLTDVVVKRTRKVPAKATGKATAKGKAKRKAAPVPVSTEQRRQLIAEAAYFRALSRGFEDGDPVADWLDAEREVDKSLAGESD